MMPLIRCFLLACLFGYIPLASADWINLTGAETSNNIAEIYVLGDHVKLVLEVYVGDLDTFEELVPDDWIKASVEERVSVEQRMQTFATERFQFVTEEGVQLPAHLQLVEPRMRVNRKSPFAGMINPLTRQRVPEAPADKRVLYAEIHYPFEQKPQQLTIVPPLDDSGIAQVTIGFIAYHKAVPVIDFRYLGQPAVLHLDWDDPWYTRFENPNLKRHHKSALMSFLYVEPFEVRHEILTRVRDLEQWMDLGLRGNEYIEIDELEPLKQRIGEFLLTKNPVRIDGQSLEPILDRSNYVKVALTGIQLVEKPERLEISTAIVGVIITYLTEQIPQQVTVDWELFNDQIDRVPATAIDPAGPLVTYVTPDDSVHAWTNYLKNYRMPTVEELDVSGSLSEFRIPLITLAGAVIGLLLLWQLRRRRRAQQPVRGLVIGLLATIAVSVIAWPYLNLTMKRPEAIAGALKDEQAQVLLQALLKNVYRAFDFREEQDVYDKLALSVSGDLLADIYLQNRKSFAVQKAGGAQAKVRDVTILGASAERLDEKGLAYRIRGNWTASGTVGHWGHVHVRENLYDAELKVQAVDGKWKITALELLEEKRVEPGQAQVPGDTTSQR
jgi:hypothetical protein